jgi:hypothetical protein
MTGDTSGTGTAYPSGIPKFNPSFLKGTFCSYRPIYKFRVLISASISALKRCSVLFYSHLCCKMVYVCYLYLFNYSGVQQESHTTLFRVVLK